MNYTTKRFEKWKEQWSEPSKVGLADYISFNIHPEDAIILGSLFFPNLIEIDNCLLFETHFNYESYLRWKEELRGDRTGIEKMINHIHLYDVFAQCSEKVSDEVYDKIAIILQLSWNSYFHQKYSSKDIVVEYVNGEMDYGPTLYVYQR